MLTIEFNEVELRLSDVLDLAQTEPVTVTLCGRPIVIMMNFEDAQEALRIKAGRQLMGLLDSIQARPAASALSEVEINQMVHRLRQ